MKHSKHSSFTRRGFLAGSALAGLALTAPGLMAADRKPFRLKYAPSPGQFKNLAGNDIVDQIQFAADQGFTAWEDNGMREREVSEQERIAAALQKHDKLPCGQKGFTCRMVEVHWNHHLCCTSWKRRNIALGV